MTDAWDPLSSTYIRIDRGSCAGCGILEGNRSSIGFHLIDEQLWCDWCLAEARRGAVMVREDLRGPGRPALARP